MRNCLILYSLIFLGACAQTFIFPEIKEPKEAKTFYVVLDKAFSLTCLAEGNPSYQWLRDEKVVTTETYMGQNLSTVQSGNLTFEPYSSRFDGVYTCKATTEGVTTMSKPQTLLQLTLNPFTISKEKNLAVNEYSYAHLKCENQGKLVGIRGHDYGYNWSPNSGFGNERTFTDETGDLHFTYVMRSDKKRYYCSYVSGRASMGYQGNAISVTVNNIGNAQATEPTFQYSNNLVTGFLESSARLECFFSGYDPESNNNIPTIKWFDKDKEIEGNEKYQFSHWNRVLVIKYLQGDDEKTFFCQGFTSVGMSKRMSVYLNVTSKPIWVAAPTSQAVMNRDKAVFVCDAKSLPNEKEPDTPEWYKNGERIDESKMLMNKALLSIDKKTMTIYDVDLDDIQCVQCVVRNSVGSVMESACLDVLGDITVNFGSEKSKAESKVHLTFLHLMLFTVSVIIVYVLIVVLSAMWYGNKSEEITLSPSISRDNNY